MVLCALPALTPSILVAVKRVASDLNMRVLIHLTGLVLLSWGAHAGVGRGRNSHRVSESLAQTIFLQHKFIRDLSKTLSPVTSSRTQRLATALTTLGLKLKKVNMKLVRLK